MIRDTETKRLRKGRLLVQALILAGAVAAVALVVAVVPQRRKEPEIRERPPLNVEVEVITPRKNMPDELELNGSVEPYRTVTVSAEVDGRVEAYARWKDPPTTTGAPPPGPAAGRGRPLDEGDPVAAGRPILYLNTDLLQADRDQANAQLQYAVRDLETARELRAREVATALEVDQKQTQVALQRARLAAAEARLRRAAVHAPNAGTLNRLLVEEGEYVRAGNAVAEIVDTSRVKVVVAVPEMDIARLRVGDVHRILLPNGDEPIPGRVTYISRTAHEGTRTTRVEMTVDNAGDGLRSGQILRVRLKRRDLRNAIMIPLGVVIPREKRGPAGETTTDNEYTVYVVEGDLAQPRAVRIDIGFIRGARIRVLNGLKAGDRLIVKGHRLCGPGQRVKVSNGSATRPAAAPDSRPVQE